MILNEKNYKTVLDSGELAFIFFTSKGCHLCVKLKPVLKKLEKEFKTKLEFYSCDIDEQKALAKVFIKDEGVPTGFVSKGGSVFKIKDPKTPDDDCWYSEKYLKDLIEALVKG